MDMRIIYAAIVAFATAIISGPAVIWYLRRLKFGQTVRSEGPKSHLKKTGIPTMGGIMILLATTVATLIFQPDSLDVISALVVTLGFGLIGDR